MPTPPPPPPPVHPSSLTVAFSDSRPFTFSRPSTAIRFHFREARCCVFSLSSSPAPLHYFFRRLCFCRFYSASRSSPDSQLWHNYLWGSNERLLDAPMPLADAGMEELIAPRSNRGAISAICNLTVTRWLRGVRGGGGQNKLRNRNFRDGRSDDGAKCGITEFEYPYIRTRVYIRGRGGGGVGEWLR